MARLVSAWETGRQGEKAVAEYLIKKKYVIVANNYAVPGGEIDIVAYKGGVLAFTEVKTRSGINYGAPAEAVNKEKQRRIKLTSKGFLEEQLIFGKLPVWSKLFRCQIKRKIKFIRYDIAEVYKTKDGMKINYIENGFE